MTTSATASDSVSQATGPKAVSKIQPRRPTFDYSSVPRHWLNGNMYATHMVNGLNLLFPWGERFFVRSVKRYLPQVEGTQERADIRGFFGQEGRHAAEHERFFKLLEAQGFEVREFLDWYEKWAGRVEAMSPPALRLAGTSAAEHFTAMFADAALREGLLEDADPAVRDLLLWHAVEEIEHKAVAYDVLQKVAPSYALRVAGLLIASVQLGFYWYHATRMLMEQDNFDPERHEQEKSDMRASGFMNPARLWAGIRDYLRPDFHPWQLDNSELAKAHLRRANLETS